MLNQISMLTVKEDIPVFPETTVIGGTVITIYTFLFLFLDKQTSFSCSEKAFLDGVVKFQGGPLKFTMWFSKYTLTKISRFEDKKT